MSLNKKIIHGFSWSFADKLFNQLGYLLVVLFIARHVGPEIFGVIGILTVFMAFSESIINNGFSQALIQKSNKLTEAEASTVFYFCLIWGCIVYVFLYLIVPYVALYFEQPLIEKVGYIVFITVIFNSLSIVVRAKLTIDIDFKKIAIASLISTLLSSFIALFALSLGHGFYSLVFLIFSKSLFQTIFLWLFCKWLPKFIFSLNELRVKFRFAVKIMTAHLLISLNNGFITFFIGKKYSVEEVGLFSQATNLSTYAYQLLASTVQGVTYPVMSSIKENSLELKYFYTKTIKITTMLSFPLFFGFAAVAEDFVDVFLGPQWSGLVPFLIGLSLSRCLGPISEITTNMLLTTDRASIYLRIECLKFVFVISIFMLFSFFGTYAILLSIIISSVVAFFLYSYYSGVIFGFGIIEIISSFRNYLFGSVIMTVVINFINFDYPIISLILKIILGIMIYLLTLWMLKDDIFCQQAALLKSTLKTRTRN